MAAQANGQTGNGGKGNKTVVILLGVIIVLLVGVIGVFGAMLIKSNKANVEKQEKRNVVVSQNNAEEVAEELIQEQYVEPGYYNAQMTMEWHFATGDAESDNAVVVNDSSNTNDVYFDVFLAEDESTPILQSPVIPRGGELNNIKLDTPLGAGKYDCVMIYHLVDENQDTVSTLRVGFTIVVEQ